MATACTFETLTKRFAIEDKAVRKIGEMIHDADLDDAKFQRVEGIGIDRVLKGWGKTAMRDDEILAARLRIASTAFTNSYNDDEPETLARQEKSRGVKTHHPTFGEAFRFWLKLGFISFGGPTGQIAIMQTELVEKKRWISQARFLHALNYCMLLPGPEAQQLATYIGWLLHKTWGGIVAGALFVIPSIFILWGLSFVYAAYGNLPWIAAIFYGLKPAVMAIVAVAVIRIGRKALKNEVMWTLAALAFVAIFFFKVPFPLIILGAGLIGFLGGYFWKSKFNVVSGHAKAGNASVLDDETESPAHTQPSLSRAIKVTVIWLVLWLAPIIVIGLWLGWNHTLFKEGVFFSKAAVVTFGGAYAVLPYVAQQALFHYGWLKPGR